jgi:hypothetical protein
MGKYLTHRWSNGGANSVSSGLDGVWKSVSQKAIFYGGEGARKCAEHLFKASQELVPVATGNLQLSGRVIENTATRSDKKSWLVTYDTVKYSNDATSKKYNFNYAVIVHQRVRQYLGEPYRANMEYYKELIAEEMKKAFGGGN